MHTNIMLFNSFSCETITEQSQSHMYIALSRSSCHKWSYFLKFPFAFDLIVIFYLFIYMVTPKIQLASLGIHLLSLIHELTNSWCLCHRLTECCDGGRSVHQAKNAFHFFFFFSIVLNLCSILNDGETWINL